MDTTRTTEEKETERTEGGREGYSDPSFEEVGGETEIIKKEGSMRTERTEWRREGRKMTDDG